MEHLDPALAHQQRQTAGIVAVAPPANSSGALERKQRPGASQARLTRESPFAHLWRRLGTGELHLVTAIAKSRVEQEHRFGRAGPLPVTREVEDLHRSWVGFGGRGPTRSSSHSFAYLSNTWNAVAAAITKPGTPSRNPRFKR